MLFQISQILIGSDSQSSVLLLFLVHPRSWECTQGGCIHQLGPSSWLSSTINAVRWLFLQSFLLRSFCIVNVLQDVFSTSLCVLWTCSHISLFFPSEKGRGGRSFTHLTFEKRREQYQRWVCPIFQQLCQKSFGFHLDWEQF